MGLHNMKLTTFLLTYITIFIPSAFIYGCGDTVSQSSTGGGSNVNIHDGGSGAISNPAPPPTTPSTAGTFSAEGGDDETEWTDTVGCSVDSRAEGRC